MKNKIIVALMFLSMATASFAQTAVPTTVATKKITITALNGKAYTTPEKITITETSCSLDIKAKIEGVSTGTRIAFRQKGPDGTIKIIQSVYLDLQGSIALATTDASGNIQFNHNFLICGAGAWEFYDFKVMGADYDTTKDTNFDTQEKIEGTLTITAEYEATPVATATKTTVVATVTPITDLKTKSGADDLLPLIILFGMVTSSIVTFGIKPRL